MKKTPRFAKFCRLIVVLLFFTCAAAQQAGAQTGPAPTRGARNHQISPRIPPASIARPDVARFRARVESVLQGAAAKNAYWGILVTDRDTGEVLYDLNSDHFFAPASNAKVFTTALALATLGSSYRFRTTLESKAAPGADGHLNGDLIFFGRGDPDLSNRKFPYSGREEHDGPVDVVLEEMAAQAAANGLKELDGDIIADDSYYPYDPYPEGWTTGDLFFSFGAPVSAIVLNDNIVSVQVSPGVNAGDPAMIQTQPPAASETITSLVTTGQPGTKSDFAVVRQPGIFFTLLRGSIPVGHSPARLDLAMIAPAETAGLALKQALEARGVIVTGQVHVQHQPPPYSDAAGEPIIPENAAASRSSMNVLAEHMSPSLLESVTATNKLSQNLHAELFVRAAGLAKLGVGSTPAGLKAERDFLRAAGVPDGEVILTDGSGLARDDLVTPHAVVALLRYAQTQSWGADFLSTLPVAGVDGTLENRMKSTAASGLIEAKTGTTEHVHALSGYATTLRGEPIAFSIFANNDVRRGSDATAPVDAIATAMVETLGAAPAAKKAK